MQQARRGGHGVFFAVFFSFFSLFFWVSVYILFPILFYFLVTVICFNYNIQRSLHVTKVFNSINEMFIVFLNSSSSITKLFNIYYKMLSEYIKLIQHLL